MGVNREKAPPPGFSEDHSAPVASDLISFD